MPSVDVCVVGHVTRDRIRAPGRPEAVRPGGAAWYAAWALAGLGARVRLLTRVAPQDAELLSEARDRMDVRIGLATRTTAFENVYDEAGQRTQRVEAVAEPWAVGDLPAEAVGAWLFGPLTPGDVGLALLRAAAARAPVALDVQGLVRDTAADPVQPCRPVEPEEWLPEVAIVKADASEASLCTGESAPAAAAERLRQLGATEALVTLGAEGALLATPEGVDTVPAFAVTEAVDPTGCGDTFLAAYLWARLDGRAPGSAARFAAAAAALELERAGPLFASPAEVWARGER